MSVEVSLEPSVEVSVEASVEKPVALPMAMPAEVDLAAPRPAAEFTADDATSAPPLALAGADDDLPEPHIVRGID